LSGPRLSELPETTMMKVQRIPLSDDLRRTIATNLEIGRAAHRREVIRFPVRNRWLIVRARTHETWRELLQDLVYLVRGR
jgi:hypothetical protein